MANHFSTKFVGELIPGVQTAGIDLNPSRDDHRFVKYWKHEMWLAIRRKAKTDDAEEPVFSIFMEDEFGNPIPEGVRRALRNDVYGFWIDKGTCIEGYQETGLTTKESFRTIMEGKYPWLRLCEGHWKVVQVWTNCLTTYSRRSKSKDTDSKTQHKMAPTSTASTNRNGIPIIKMETDSSVSAGSKRGHEDDSDEQLPKKHKAKEVAPSFHPARPQRTKPKAKVVKVSIFPFLLAEYLLRRL